MLSQSLVPIIPFGALPTDYTRVKDSKQFSSFARTRTRFVRCLFLPTLPFRFLYCPGNFDDAWNIYFAFQFRVPQEWKRSGDPENSERLTRTFHARNSLSQVSRGFSNVSRLKRPSTWPRAILDRLFARLHFPFEAHSLQISGQRLRKCNRNSVWNIGIDPSARENKLFRVCYEFLELIFFLLLCGILRKFEFQFESFRTRLWGEMR